MTTPKSQMNLHRLMADFAFLNGVQDGAVCGLSSDSRKVKTGDVFFALRSSNDEKHTKQVLNYVRQACENGALAVVYDQHFDELFKAETSIQTLSVPLISVAHLDRKLGLIAARFYGHPANSMKVIGITGTNGKTSSTQFVAQCLQTDATPCGLIGTLGNGIWGQLKPTHFTTPPALELQQSLAELRDQGATYSVMEVSSHALDQGRAEGITFETAVLTNLTHDHLDYHGDMVSYAKAKQRLFLTPKLAYAVLNIDDAFGMQVLEQLPKSVKAITYSISQSVAPKGSQLHIFGQIDQLDIEGIHLTVVAGDENGKLKCRLLGAFNASNLLAVVGVLLSLKISFPDVLSAVSKVTPPPGRMERFGGKGNSPLVVVDYAHTPDALEKVLLTLRSHCSGQLWVVFGCGGDRDRAKRPRMGEIAARHADHVIVTDDNPRTENSVQIVEDILRGINEASRAQVEHDRAKAIAMAVQQSKPKDIVLIAGKGHEDYQIVGHERRFFSDQLVVKNLLKEAA